MKDREKEFQKIKMLIKQNIKDAECGIFSCRNLAGDMMTSLFDGQFFSLDICYYLNYFELFGTNDAEWQEIEKYYSSLGGLVL